MTTYLVTGATGFLGGQLVERLLADADAEVHVVVREASRGKLAARLRRWPGGERVRVVVGDLLLPELGIDPATAARAAGAGRRPPRAPGGPLRHDRRRRHERSGERRWHRGRRAGRQPAGGRLPPPRLLGGGGRRPRGRLHRGHVRRGPAAHVAVPPHQVRGRAHRPRAGRGAVARLPARHRRRALGHRRDRQDRRPLLPLRDDPTAGQPAVARSGSSRPTSATRTSSRSTTSPTPCTT